jgi:hypothetical protein
MAGLAAVLSRIILRERRAEGWRPHANLRVVALAAAGLLLCVPFAVASGDYSPTPRPSAASREATLDAELVPPGARPGSGVDPLLIGEWTRLDLLVQAPRAGQFQATALPSAGLEARVSGAPATEGSLVRVPLALRAEGASGLTANVHGVAVQLSSGASTYRASALVLADAAHPATTLALAGLATVLPPAALALRRARRGAA